MGFNFITSREHLLLKNLLDGHLQSWLHKEKRVFIHIDEAGRN